MTKIFRGGVVIGLSHWESVRYSRPFAKLIFRDDALVISARFLWKGEYVLDCGTYYETIITNQGEEYDG